MTADDLAARLAAIERRLDALEGRPTLVAAEAVRPEAKSANTDRSTDRSAGANKSAEAEQFWALNRLEADYPAGAVLYAGHVQLPTGERWLWQEGSLTQFLLSADWEGAAPALAALGHPLRLAILQAVLHGKRTTAELQAEPTLAVGGKLYHHLRDLQAGGWLLLQGRGQYTVPAEKVIPLLIILRATGAVSVEAAASQ